MPRDFKLPDLGEGIHEAQVIRVLIQTGQTVKEDQPLMEVETDKAAVEIPSPFGGTVTAVNVKEGQTIHVGDVIVSFDESGGATSASAAAASPAAPAASVPARSAPEPAAGSAPAPAPMTAKPAAPDSGTDGRTKTAAAPAVRKAAREMGINLDTVKGTGPGGRVTREDLEAHVASRTAAASSPAPAASASVGGGMKPVAAPAAAAPVAPAVSMVAPMPSAPPPGTPGQDAWGATRIAPLSQIRKAIARQMAKSAFTIPHVTHGDEADITELERLRKELSAAGGVKLTLMPFLVKAVCVALRKFPVLNSSFDEEAGAAVYKEYINMGIAVDTDRGLVVPNIRNADRLTLTGIADALAAMANKARANQFSIDDLRGGTFTITNVGPMGGTFATPIINHPEVGILGLGRSRRAPVFGENDVVKAATVLPVFLSFDHRATDGVTAARFVREIVAYLEKPQLLLLY